MATLLGASCGSGAVLITKDAQMNRKTWFLPFRELIVCGGTPTPRCFGKGSNTDYLVQFGPDLGPSIYFLNDYFLFTWDMAGLEDESKH